MVVVLVTGCGGDGGDDDGAGPGSTSTTAAPVPTIPGDAEPGTGWLSLEGDAIELQVTTCAGEDPAPADPTAQRLYELVSTATVDGDEVTVTASEIRTDSGDAVTTTQTIAVTSGEGEARVGLEAKRSLLDDRWVDLNDPSATDPLLERGGDLVHATASFGPQGSRAGDPRIVPGAFIARCPEGGGG
jgi:hypothetical protein